MNLDIAHILLSFLPIFIILALVAGYFLYSRGQNRNRG
ncbi:hypothetical protein MEZE111188_17950 [Mesobacillus zeae]